MNRCTHYISKGGKTKRVPNGKAHTDNIGIYFNTLRQTETKTETKGELKDLEQQLHESDPIIKHILYSSARLRGEDRVITSSHSQCNTHL